jgi:hypothetical protein
MVVPAGILYFKGFITEAGKDTWAAFKTGIRSLKQHQWRHRKPRGIWLILPVPTPEGIRWLGFMLPPGEDALQVALDGLEDAQLPVPRLGHGVTWMEWEATKKQWREPPALKPDPR